MSGKPHKNKSIQVDWKTHQMIEEAAIEEDTTMKRIVKKAMKIYDNNYDEGIVRRGVYEALRWHYATLYDVASRCVDKEDLPPKSYIMRPEYQKDEVI